jgi:hypothetical protein
MPAATPEERALIAQIATAVRWGREPDRTAATAPAREGLRAKYAREVDPDGNLGTAELERRVDSLMRAHVLRMSLAAKASRRRRGKQLRKLTAPRPPSRLPLARRMRPDGPERTATPNLAPRLLVRMRGSR